MNVRIKAWTPSIERSIGNSEPMENVITSFRNVDVAMGFTCFGNCRPLKRRTAHPCALATNVGTYLLPFEMLLMQKDMLAGKPRAQEDDDSSPSDKGPGKINVSYFSNNR